MMQFDLPKDPSSIIKVIGVGGGGSNAVNHMFRQGIRGVDFIVCNTDKQALDSSPVPNKIQLGESLTGGNGAGAIPEVGKNAAIETIDEVRAILARNTTMVFITAGMGGGTGTGAAPIIAKLAREMGILTVGIVTMPFSFEGRKRKDQAESGLRQMQEACDTLLVVKNDKLREVYGNMTLKEAFCKADDVLAVAARGIAEVISITGEINVDMNDVKTVMSNSGLAIMGSGEAGGANRARLAVEAAIESPLLNDNDINGAKYVMLNITMGNHDVMFEEIYEITDYIQNVAGAETDLIWGYGVDETLGDNIRVSVIATGFEARLDLGVGIAKEQQVKVNVLSDEMRPIEQPIKSPMDRIERSVTQIEAEKKEQEPYLINKKELNVPEKEEQEISFTLFEAPVAEKTIEIQADKPEEKVMYSLDDNYEPEVKEPINLPKVEPVVAKAQEEPARVKPSSAEQQRMMEERFNKIKELNMKLRSSSGLTDLEKEPAINRMKTATTSKASYSADSNQSRFSISESGEIRRGNSFLHDNVD